jgi:L-fuconolactonase
MAEDKPVSAIIDTHTHFYDPTRPQGVPWPAKTDTLLYQPFLPPTYQPVAQSAGVTGTVVIEASPWLEDNQWLLDLAKDDPFIVGCIGYLDLLDPHYSLNLKRFSAFNKFRGIRSRGHIVVQQLDNPGFITALKQLADQDYSLDLLCTVQQLPAITQLSQRIPNLRIILDHCASVSIDGKAPPADWQQEITACAAQPLIYCKVSGLVEATGNKDGTAPSDLAFYKPVLDILWERFGNQRVIYGSNWPVSLRCAPYAQVQALVMTYVRSKGVAATNDYFAENARRFYKYITA